MPTEQVRHSPTCSRKARFTFKANSRATGTCRSVPMSLQAISSIEHTFSTGRLAGVDRLQDAFVILGVEPVISVHRDHGRAKLARLAHQGAGLDADRVRPGNHSPAQAG
jgi:hypothetical protein